jgi:hypothetical protein
LFELTWFFLGVDLDAPYTAPVKQGRWQAFGWACFLVSVPVFVQAPLVRWFPVLSLFLTGGLWALAWWLSHRYPQRWWGDLVQGFSWSWLAGSLYWGWWRSEPLMHLPIEAIALPIAIWGIRHGWGKIGHSFYLGSLVGTAITDGYFYLTDLIPYWRQAIDAPPESISIILREAVAKMETPWGMGCAVLLITLLLALGCVPLKRPSLAAWVFSGAVLSTLVVDGLFWASVYFVL